jgi:hypothetical protein
MANGAILEELDKAQKSAKTSRDRAKRGAEKIVNKAMVLGGGAAAGGIDGKYPDKKIMGVRQPMLAGAALSIVGLMNAAGRYSDAIGSLGDGMLAYELGLMVKARVKPATTTTAGVDYVGAGSYAGQMGQQQRSITAEELEATLMQLRR